VVEHFKPLTPQQFTNLREKLKELQEKRAAAQRKDGETNTTWTAAEEQQLAEIRKKVAVPPNRMANPALAERVRVEVRVASEAAAGRREIRLGTATGLTNPLTFELGDLAEVTERGATAESAGVRPGPNAREPGTRILRPAIEVRLPAVVNGRILPGEVDRYRFAARRGQRVVAAVQARNLIPYLPDAVPGWFQATLTLLDGKGKEVVYNDDYQFQPDPVLLCEIPRDGEYLLEVKDAIYRGREDFVYRMTVGELPFITGVFPLGAPVGQATSVEVRGWNIESTNLVWDRPELKRGVHGLRLEAGGRWSNEIPFALDTLPETAEREPNDSTTAAQACAAPVIINGRIERVGDWDWFRFQGRPGDRMVAEVQARRLDSPLDSAIQVTDSAGRQLAWCDDADDRGAGLNTHQADSRVEWTVPAAGTFLVRVGDAQARSGPEYAYRLRVSPPRPDFDLRLVPSSLAVRAGGTAPLTVHALRRDGYAGEILLALVGAPPGLSLAGGRIPAGSDAVRITVTTPPGEAGETLDLRLEGRAVIEGDVVSRLAVPVEDMMQAFAYRHWVPAQECKVRLTDGGRWRPALRVVGAKPVRLPLGGTARLQIGAPPRLLADRVQLELSEPPEGIELEGVMPNREGTELVLRADGAKAKVGLTGNLIVQAHGPGGRGPGGRPQAGRRRVPLDTLPAIPFEVVAGE
jgi:hypothetical protein